MTIALPRGAVLNERYVVQEELGRGTRGVVHAAKDLMAMRRVAIKILSNDAGPLGERLGAELTSEAHALKHARVPGVVRFLDEGRHDGMQYLVTELVDGIEFPGGVASAEKRAPGDAELKPLGRQLVGLASTLRRVHALGMVHGDIKPQNVLVRSSTAECVLLDFGFSRLVRLAAKEGVSSGRVVGTPLYMAPEMIGGYEATPASDIYATGVMAFEALTGQRPHPGTKWLKVMSQRLAHPAPKVEEVAPWVPEGLAVWVDAMLLRDPVERIERVAQLWPSASGSGSVVDLGARVHWGVDELAQFFDGPSAVLKVPRRAALQLYLRTGGERGAVERALASWSAHGVTVLDAGRYTCTPAMLVALEDGLFYGPHTPIADAAAPLSCARTARVLALAHEFGRRFDRHTLERALGVEREEFDACIARAQEVGVAVAAEGRVFVTASAELIADAQRLVAGRGQGGRDAEALRAVLDVSHSGYVRCVLLALDPSEIAPRLVEELAPLLDAGRYDEAHRAMALGYEHLDAGKVKWSVKAAYLLEWARVVARMSGSEGPTEELLGRMYEVSRGQEALGQLRERLDAACALFEVRRLVYTTGSRGLMSELVALGALGAHEFELLRIALRAQLLSRRPFAEFMDGLDELWRSADLLFEDGEMRTDVRARMKNYRAQALYLLGKDFSQAAKLHREAAAERSSAHARCWSLMRAADCHLNAFELGEAQECALEASMRAERMGALGLYCFANAVLSHVKLRLGDLAHMDLYKQCNPAWGTGSDEVMKLIEGSKALRRGERSAARALLSDARRTFLDRGHSMWALAHGAALLAGEDPEVFGATSQQLMEASRRIRAPRVRMQVRSCFSIALSKAEPQLGRELALGIQEDAEDVSPEYSIVVLDVLSTDECVAVARSERLPNFVVAPR